LIFIPQMEYHWPMLGNDENSIATRIKSSLETLKGVFVVILVVVAIPIFFVSIKHTLEDYFPSILLPNHLPFKASWRSAIIGNSLVLQLWNDSHEPVNNITAAYNGDGFGHQIASTVAPGQLLEIGHMELPRTPKKGDIIVIADGQGRFGYFKVPGPE